MNTERPIIFLVDDEPSVLKALSRLLRSEGLDVLTFDSPEAFLERHDPNAFGCIVLDFSMPGIDGLSLQQELADRNSLLPIVFLTGHGDIPASVEAMKGGAVDFLTKPVDEAKLLQAIRASLERNRAAREHQAEQLDYRQRVDALTPREREVLEHVVTGQLNKQIAADLGTVEKTIKVHRAHVMEKMKVGSVAELVRIVERAGLYPAAARSY